DILQSLGDLLHKNAELIQACRPRTPFNRCGYLLHDVVTPDHLDLARLLVGSEGTLAVFTEAILRTIPLPAGRGVVLLGLASLDASLGATVRAMPTGPAACELSDRRLLSLVRGGTDVMPLIPAGAEAVLLVEYEADSPIAAREKVTELIDRLQGADRLA